MNQIVIQAIRDHLTLEVRYHGYSRIVEPHAYGTNAKYQPLLRCYQISGGSESGERAGWKLLLLDEARGITATAQKFAGARPGYRRGDSAMQHILAQL